MSTQSSPFNEVLL